MTEEELEEIAVGRAEQKQAELVVKQLADGGWEARYDQDSQVVGRAALASSGPSQTRCDALQRLVAIDDILAQADEHAGA
ncbi:MAG TPA: hypothetical protein VGU02_03960 [Gaiellaceae bacterium]|nr:hypothetical protein [Gaiellaceae bacterium]